LFAQPFTSSPPTPDNLFGGNPSTHPCGSEDPFETGVDIESGGKAYGYPNLVCSTSRHLKDDLDPGHGHGSFADQYDNGNMDKPCWDRTLMHINPDCYAYVPISDAQPYFDIATNYGFANYMFQTNQGPSFPAHQFIFSGTSAPVPHHTGFDYDWFASENPDGVPFAGSHTGCTAHTTQPNEFAILMDHTGFEQTSGYCSTHVGSPYCLTPCYEHADSPYTNGTLADLLENQTPPITWKYYTPEMVHPSGDIESGLWAAPIAIRHLCGEKNLNSGKCDGLLPGGTHYNNMRYETDTNPYPIIDDVDVTKKCQLAAVSWVIPDKLWSDHAGAGENNGSGPAYVANIVNAIGNSSCKNPDGTSYWDTTAIFITWDDWGGWFDHVPPFQVKGPNCLEWGCNYVYGFRVPLLLGK
jgi:hypothetical protein